MFILRELRGGVHSNALTNSGVTPVEAHMLNKGHQYTTMFGWPEPFADGTDKKDRYAGGRADDQPPDGRDFRGRPRPRRGRTNLPD